MTTNTAEFLQEQKRLAEAATEGPWFQGRDERAYENAREVYSKREPEESGSHDIATFTWSDADAEFIAAARSSVPKLIAAVEAVMALRDLVSRPGDAPHVLSTIAGYNRALTVVRAAIEAALIGGEGE